MKEKRERGNNSGFNQVWTGAPDDKLQTCRATKELLQLLTVAMTDGSNSALENGNVRGRVHNKVLSSSSETDTNTPLPPPLEKNGCEINTQKHVHKVRSVVQPSDTNKNKALQESIKSDHQNNRELLPFSGPGSLENRNVAIENNNENH